MAKCFVGFTNQGDLSALRDDVTCGKGRGRQRKGGGKRKTIVFSPSVLLFSQFPYLELDMINKDVLLLYVSMDHKAHDWFPASA
jgi:hypothetical protein